MKAGRHICTVCNYIYEEPSIQPDPKQPLLPFDQLSEDWKCPSCGASKEMFQPCSCVSVTPSQAQAHARPHSG